MTRLPTALSLSMMNALLLVLTLSVTFSVSSQLKDTHLSSLSSAPTSSGNQSSPSLPLFAIILVIILPIICGFSCPAIQFILFRRVAESRQIFSATCSPPNKNSKVITNVNKHSSTSAAARYQLSSLLTWSLFHRDSDSNKQILRQDDDSTGQPVDIEASSSASDKRKNRSLFADLTHFSE